MVPRKVKHFGQRGDLGARPQVDADQPQDRLVDHPKKAFHRRTRIPTALPTHGQVDRDVEHPRTLGIVHAQKENVAPAAVAQIHTHWGRLVQNRKQPLRGHLPQQLTHPQRLVRRMADAEHPLVAAHRTHAAPHLVGQGLKTQPTVGLGPRTGRGVAERRSQQQVDGLFKTTLEQVVVPLERHPPPRRQPCLARQVKPIDGIQKKERTHPLVQVVALPTKPVERSTLPQQLLQRGRTTEEIQRTVAQLRMTRGDDRNQMAHRNR